jgi:hypothetical protein
MVIKNEKFRHSQSITKFKNYFRFLNYESKE